MERLQALACSLRVLPFPGPKFRISKFRIRESKFSMDAVGFGFTAVAFWRKRTNPKLTLKRKRKGGEKLINHRNPIINLYNPKG